MTAVIGASGPELSDLRADPDLRALAEIAGAVCDVPTAVVNLLDERSQHQIAAVGVEPTVCAREEAMCSVTVAQPQRVLVVPDASVDARFAAHPYVDGSRDDIRFYAAAQLLAPGGRVLGTLCAFDREARRLSSAQQRRLAQLADLVVDVLEVRRQSRELREVVGELSRNRAELERSNEHLAAFAGQVAHDLSGPLTGVLGWLEELADSDGVRDDAGARAAVDSAVSAGTRMRALLTELLDYARVGGAVRRDRVALDDLVADVVADRRDVLRAVDLRVGPLPAVLGEAAALGSVLGNLLHNAVKYAAPGRPPRIEVCGRREGDRVRLEVVDNGIGIPAPRRADALRPLARVHDPAQLGGRDPGGTGIGLAACRRIVHAHGGDLVLDDGPDGIGTRVVVTLPAADPPHPR